MSSSVAVRADMPTGMTVALSAGGDRAILTATGAVATLKDPYAGYDSPAAYHAFNNPKPDQFSGVGVDVTGTRTGVSRASISVESREM